MPTIRQRSCASGVQHFVHVPNGDDHGDGIDEHDRDLLCEVASYYHSALARCASAAERLAQLGLGDPALLARFRLGCSDRALGRTLTAHEPGERARRAALRRLGLIRASGHEHFTGCLVVPVLDVTGAVQQLYGHPLAARRGAPRQARWLPLAVSHPWNAAALSEPGELIICNDVLDALTLWGAGHRRVVAFPSAGVPNEHAWLITRLSEHGVDRVRIAFASNAEGNLAADRLVGALRVTGVGATRIALPRGFDIRTFARVHPPAAESLGALLRGVLPAPPSTSVLNTGLSQRRATTIQSPWHPSAGLGSDIECHLEALAVAGYAPTTISARRAQLRRFAGVIAGLGVTRSAQVTSEMLERTLLMLESCDAPGARPCSPSRHANRITAVRMLFTWAVRTRRLERNPASDLVRPRLPRQLPRAVLSATEAEVVLARPNTSTVLGLRDRAILELLYSTGIRRMEVVGLDLADLDSARGVLFIRQGKGRKDRYVPIGDRALDWTHRYLDGARPCQLRAGDPGALFLSARGARMRPSRLTEQLHRHVMAAGVGKSGSCHIFRHTMATVMHDGGADIRDLQAMLGHALLNTTQIYTHVSIARLKEVHTQTHPARFAR